VLVLPTDAARHSSDWYKSRNYRSRMVREPRAVLASSTEDPAQTRVRVHDSTADMRYLVLPMRPRVLAAGAKSGSPRW